MIDSIFVSPNVHVTIGTFVVLSALLALAVTGVSVWKHKRFTAPAQISLIFFQVVLILQVLVGIKLLDQGLGPLQLFIHYLGGLAPLAFCLIFYWLPIKRDILKIRAALGVMTLSVVFVIMTFAIGSMYIAGGA